MSEKYPKVYIIVLNWNGWRDTIECLESVLKLSYQNFSVVIVDNGSTDGSAAKIKEWIAKQGRQDTLVFIETGKNLGYAGGNNAGLRYALDRGDLEYAWVLNNDTVVDPDALAQLVKRIEEKPGAGFCGSLVLYYNDRGRVSAVGGGFYDKWLGQAVHPGAAKPHEPDKIEKYIGFESKINYIEGASTLVSRGFLHDIGLMSEDYFLFFEEIDWATRARGKYSLAIAPKSLVYHKGGASVKSNRIFDHYNTRNRILFTRKYYPYALPTVLLSVLGYCLDRAIHGEWENARIIVKAAAEILFTPPH
ncbi:hypothetical protein A2625_00200 [candidate division WOR-1 bacterium RIFCSPHIGHO2_01_FULL_53_15]|uniref:Glycosyltransferase 2-like domain-containing protein n=1 Tax=candidate division WOR-1 bacterium RIFCSPHIGHO2_01_FULL_53_15 TaxID=1802564 RepID=A0A1F4Q229_UNCSA|nr:MAG: hypothetical protein A2625_00200 [candidate division WOR-1 bacterium RIFCSPHIGHO2_01_FULL_53_15]OGC13398.1 MAG: hypothetical protein A3D23_04500 [candidate division WOR-1 bacterium RIFCSPHIGHO2_02_FULL_53_26]